MDNAQIPHWLAQPPQHIATKTRLLLPTRGLLTLKLTAQCGAPLQVQTLFEDFGQILPDEAIALALPENSAGWVRAVLLNCHNKPMIYARSFVPLGSHKQQTAFLQRQHTFSDIKTLGSQPLGLWLAKQHDLKRTPFQFSVSPANYWPHWSGHAPQQNLAARQSIFERQQAQLLLTEVFLD
jgi:chorismate--pyruvate lyase